MIISSVLIYVILRCLCAKTHTFLLLKRERYIQDTDMVSQEEENCQNVGCFFAILLKIYHDIAESQVMRVCVKIGPVAVVRCLIYSIFLLLANHCLNQIYNWQDFRHVFNDGGCLIMKTCTH
jgi:hypothetical protein